MASVAPHRRVIHALTVVTVFWAGVALAVGFYEDPKRIVTGIVTIPWRIAWILSVAALSVGLVLAGDAYRFFVVTMGLRPARHRGATTTIGFLPDPLLPERKPLAKRARENALWKILESLKGQPHAQRLHIDAVWDLATGPESDTQRLFWAVFEILHTADLPASSVEGAHGGASLLEHSLRVAAAMGKLWEGVGIPNLPKDSDHIGQKPYDRDFAIVIGLAHDIGKVRCFRRKDGRITVVGLHDMVGSRILGLLPETWELRNAKDVADDYRIRLLTQSIRYYHHAYAYPGSGKTRNQIYQDDVVVDLMRLIHEADMVAGAIEGREQEIAKDYSDPGELQEMDIAEQVWEAFLFLLENPGRINAKNPQHRLGYKQGKILYLIENKLREMICDHLDLQARPDYSGNNNGNPGKIIQIIATKLDELELLKKEFQDKICKKPQGAGFYLTFAGTNKEGEASEADANIPHYLLRIDGVLERLSSLEDYSAKIVVKAPTWPQYFTTRKEGDDPASAKAGNEDLAAKPAAERPKPVAGQNAAVSPSSDTESHEEEEPKGESSEDADVPPDPDMEDGSEETPGADVVADDPFADVENQVQTEGDNSAADASSPATPAVEPPHETPSPSVAQEAAALTEVEREQRQRRKEELQRAREQSKVQNQKRLITRQLDTEDERIDKIRARVKNTFATQKEIIPQHMTRENTDSARKQALFVLLWMDQARRDHALAEGETSSGSPTHTFAEIFSWPLYQQDEKDLFLSTLDVLARGSFFVIPLRMKVQVVLSGDGTVNLEKSSLQAPIHVTP